VCLKSRHRGDCHGFILHPLSAGPCQSQSGAGTTDAGDHRSPGRQGTTGNPVPVGWGQARRVRLFGPDLVGLPTSRYADPQSCPGPVPQVQEDQEAESSPWRPRVLQSPGACGHVGRQGPVRAFAAHWRSCQNRQAQRLVHALICRRCETDQAHVKEKKNMVLSAKEISSPFPAGVPQEAKRTGSLRDPVRQVRFCRSPRGCPRRPAVWDLLGRYRSSSGLLNPVAESAVPGLRYDLQPRQCDGAAAAVAASVAALVHAAQGGLHLG
jgi:hypothetical protein